MPVEVDNRTGERVDEPALARLVEGVIEGAGLGDAEASVLLVDAAEMQALNRTHRGLDAETDVLAFPIDDELVDGGRVPDAGSSGPDRTPPDPSEVPLLLGDVFVCPAVAQRNAPDHAGTYADELALLVVHGILHVLGMDHADADTEAAMQRRERELLARLAPPSSSSPSSGGP